jgi:hypothetical protein
LSFKQAQHHSYTQATFLHVTAMSSGSYQQEMGGSNLTQQQHGMDGHHHGSYSQQAPLLLQQEQGSQEAPQQDMLTQQLHQLLVADTTRFWTATVAPSAQSIHQVSDCGGARLAIISGPYSCPAWIMLCWCTPAISVNQLLRLHASASILSCSGLLL